MVAGYPEWRVLGKVFLSIVGDCVADGENRKFEEGLNSKFKLSLYKTFNKVVEFKEWSE